MHVFEPDVEALGKAKASQFPILVLPPLHPEYIRALLLAWATREGSVELKLLEPGVGRSPLELESSGLPNGRLGLLRRGSSSTDLLLDQIDAAVYRPTQSTTLQILWITSVADLLAEPAASSHLAALCRRISAHELSIRLVMDTTTSTLNSSLEPWTREIDLLAPRGEPFVEFVDRVIVREVERSYPEESEGVLNLLRVRPEKGREQPITSISRGLQGLDAGTINLVIGSALAGHSAPKDAKKVDQLLERIKNERQRQLARANGLKVIDNTFEDGDLQGMNRFQRYLEYVQVLFKDPRATNRAGPSARGVLLVGLPGCGKSLAARMTARKLDVPLLKLDVGEMMGRFLGESEANLSRVLDAAEAAAPCVLWVDEIEKTLGGLGGSNEGGGTGSRMLGNLLGWMQDHRSQVYLFATANKVKILPPELLRRGRFDELWRVMLPTPEERRDIIAQKLRALPLEALSDELQTAIAKDESAISSAFRDLWQRETDGYTGADLASVVFEAWMGYVVHEKAITVKSLLDVIAGGFQPMSIQFKDDIEEMTKDLDRHGFRDVTSQNDSKLPPPVPQGRLRHVELLPPLLRPIWTTNNILMLTFKKERSESGVSIQLNPDRTAWLSWKDLSGLERKSIDAEAQRDGARIQFIETKPDVGKGRPQRWTLAVEDDVIVLTVGESRFELESKDHTSESSCLKCGKSALPNSPYCLTCKNDPRWGGQKTKRSTNPKRATNLKNGCVKCGESALPNSPYCRKCKNDPRWGGQKR